MSSLTLEFVSLVVSKTAVVLAANLLHNLSDQCEKRWSLIVSLCEGPNMARVCQKKRQPLLYSAPQPNQSLHVIMIVPEAFFASTKMF